MPVEVIACLDAEDEAAAVIERMAGLIARGAKPGDCAVIFRTNAQSRPFEDALRRAGLRYVLVGGTKFYDRREVRDFLAYLMVAHNPRNEVALLRIINYPHRGIGRETVVRLHEESIRRKAPMIDVLRDAASVPGMGERQTRAVDAFLSLLSDAGRWFGPGRLADRRRSPAGRDRPGGGAARVGQGPGSGRAPGGERARGHRRDRQLRAGESEGRDWKAIWAACPFRAARRRPTTACPIGR